MCVCVCVCVLACVYVYVNTQWPLAMDSQTAQLELEELFTYTDDWGRERKIACHAASQGSVSIKRCESSRPDCCFFRCCFNDKTFRVVCGCCACIKIV